MDVRRLMRIDLNLLVTLEVLIEERSVSLAAQRMFVTQSAMSKTLNRLRLLFGDELLIRSPAGMNPTPFAKALRPQLVTALSEASKLFRDETLAPAQFDHEFSMFLYEGLALNLLPKLLKEVREEAPRVRCKTVSTISDHIGELSKGRLDFSMHIRHPYYPDSYSVHSLGSREGAILVPKGHPLTMASAPFEQLKNYPMVSLTLPDIDDFRSDRDMGGLSQSLMMDVEYAVETTHPFTALELVKSLGGFMYVSLLLLNVPAFADQLTPIGLPEDETWHPDYVLVMHKQLENSAAHCWMRDKIISTFRALDFTYDVD